MTSVKARIMELERTAFARQRLNKGVILAMHMLARIETFLEVLLPMRSMKRL